MKEEGGSMKEEVKMRMDSPGFARTMGVVA
jgi:hypothetical protein